LTIRQIFTLDWLWRWAWTFIGRMIPIEFTWVILL
jgi:hypothetical protein